MSLAQQIEKALDEKISQQKKGKSRFANVDVGIKREGSKIVLPDDPAEMSYNEAIDVLKLKIEEESTEVRIYEVIKSFPFDGAIAFTKALQRKYGWATPVPTPGFFGPQPPTAVSVEVGPKQTTQIFWGDFKIPGINGVLSTGIHKEDGKLYFKMGGTVLKRHEKEVQEIARMTREIVANESVYRGKAIRLRTDEDGHMDWKQAPQFMDLSTINPGELIFSEEVNTQIQTNLFTPIEHTEKCRKYGIPLKRGVLLEGPYGTGKTLTAFVAADKCQANGWTFILLDRVSGLGDALQVARLYGPAVVFAEDIDRAISGDERTVEIDDILNTIDGIESKGSEIITVLTSNHVENINKAMLRPGRLDAVIRVNPPDARAVEKLIRIYARDTLAPKADLKSAAKELAGCIPAVVREAVERAKLYAISRKPESETVVITGEDLVHASRGMKAHLDLLNPKVVEQTMEQRFTDSFKEVMQEGIKGNGLYDLATKTHKFVEELAENAR